MKIYNIRCWVNPTYIVKMMERYLDDCCEFDIHITCERSRFGKKNFRGVTIRFPDGCSNADVLATLSWVQEATEKNAYFHSMQ